MLLFYRLTILNSLLAKLVVVGSFLVDNNSKTMSTWPASSNQQGVPLALFPGISGPHTALLPMPKPRRITGKKRNVYSIKLVLSSIPHKRPKHFNG